MKKVLLIAVMTAFSLFSIAGIPSVSLRDMDGAEVNTASLVANGKPVIFSFFATWCKPCMRELKAIDEVYSEWQDEKGVEMYIVSTDQGQDVKKVKPLVDGNGWTFHVLLDPNGEFKRAMNVQNIPHLFVFDGQGKIIFNHTGYTEGDEEELGKLIMGL